MKRLLLLLLSLIAAQLPAQNWVQLTSGTATDLRDVFFVSANEGFVVGEDSILLHTTDYGNTWQALPDVGAPNPGNLNAIWMTSNQNGFIAQEFLSEIPQTSNGGTSWTATGAMIGNPCYPDGLFFDGPNEGFMYGHGCFGGAYIAHWNGTTWDYSNMLDYTSTPSNAYVGIRGLAKDPASGACVAVGDYGKVFRSTDSFQSWDTIPYPDTTDFSAVDYAGSNDFYASSTAIINSIYVSRDGGNTFAYDSSYMPTFYYSGFHDIDMADDSFGVAVGFSLTTTKGFIQWRRMGSGWMNFEPVDHILRAVYVVDSTLAYAVGDSGAIYRYSPTPFGIKDGLTSQSLKIFPSPLAAGQLLTLELPTGQPWDIEVYDLQGRKIDRFEQLKGKQQLSLPAQPGMYMVRATSAGKILTAKVLVQ